MSLPLGRVVTYHRDALQRIKRITTSVDGNSHVILDNMTYNANNQVKQQIFGNGLTETRFYDLQSRLLNISLESTEQTSFSYDANSNVLTRNTTRDSHNYTYDNLDRLDTETNNGNEIDYNYDTNDNRTLKTEGNNQTTVYDITPDSNQLEAITGQSLIYDEAGNLQVDANGRQYDYNNAGRLKTITDNAQPLAEYTYNHKGQRTHKASGSETIIYHYDHSGNLISETRRDGTLIRDYLWFNGRLIAQIDGEGSNETLSYLHTDHLLTPRLATDPSQNITWRWESEAFGNTPPEASGSTTINLRFPGQYFDQETGLFYNYHRYYDPDTGRYITSDPIGLAGGLNTYGYVLQNPLKYIDPDGKQPICFVWPWGTAVCAVAAIGTAATIKQCSDGLDDLEKGFESAKKHRSEKQQALDCLLDPTCKTAIAEEHTSAAQDALEETVKNATNAAIKLGTSVPGTSVTGPLPTSVIDLAAGAVNNVALTK